MAIRAYLLDLLGIRTISDDSGDFPSVSKIHIDPSLGAAYDPVDESVTLSTANDISAYSLVGKPDAGAGVAESIPMLTQGIICRRGGDIISLQFQDNTVLAKATGDIDDLSFAEGAVLYRPVGGSLSTRAAQNVEICYPSAAALRAAVTVPVAGQVYRTSGQNTAGDGGGGEWVGLSGTAGTYTHDWYTTILPSGGNGSLALGRISGSFLTAVISDDSVISFRSPFNGGFASFSEVSGIYPQLPSQGIIAYDTGSSQLWHAVYSGTDFAGNSVAGVPTGTTGTDGKVTVFVQPGRLYIENRSAGDRTFRVNLFV